MASPQSGRLLRVLLISVSTFIAAVMLSAAIARKPIGTVFDTGRNYAHT